jgi:hypothetical protein
MEINFRGREKNRNTYKKRRRRGEEGTVLVRQKERETDRDGINRVVERYIE